MNQTIQPSERTSLRLIKLGLVWFHLAESSFVEPYQTSQFSQNESNVCCEWNIGCVIPFLQRAVIYEFSIIFAVDFTRVRNKETNLNDFFLLTMFFLFKLSLIKWTMLVMYTDMLKTLRQRQTMKWNFWCSSFRLLAFTVSHCSFAISSNISLFLNKKWWMNHRNFRTSKGTLLSFRDGKCKRFTGIFEKLFQTS